jgi:hypothetical protein
MDNTFLGKFVRQLSLVVEPLINSLKNEDDFRVLLRDLGWEIDNWPVTQLQPLTVALEEIIYTYQNLPNDATEADVLNLLGKIAMLFTVVKANVSAIANNLDGLGSSINDFVAEFPSRLFDFLITKYLNVNFSKLYSTLEFLGIVEYNYRNADSERPTYVETVLRYDLISQIVSNPLALIKSKIGWANELVFVPLQKLLFSLLSGMNIPATFNDYSISDKLYNLAFDISDKHNKVITVYPISIPNGSDYLDVEIEIIDSIDPSSVANSGLIFSLGLPSGLSLNQKLLNGFSFSVNLSTAIDKKPSFLLKPSGISFKLIDSPEASLSSASLELLLKYQPDIPKIILGKEEGTRLELRDFGFAFGANYGGETEIILDADLSGLVLVLEASESDSFIKKVLGNNAKEVSFPLSIRWSSVNGISFKGSGSLEFDVNIHEKIGPIEFSNVKVALRTSTVGQSNVKMEIGADIKGDLGPVIFTLNGLGIALRLGLYEGNAGPFDIELGFKPPSGAGVSIDAPPVKGGGFLNFDQATSTYTGGLELNFSKISFAAIGIVSTKLPGGEEGYSLLIIITAEFGPLPLGMGFTLNGLGGILGLHRTMNPYVLRSGIRDNTLDHILFPKDVVKNANTIISNIGQAFPIQQGQFLVGPMAKIGWGTPTLLTIDLGIIIELPDPVRLAILGVVRALLPSEDNPIVRIQINFLGIIDFTNKYLSFDASLYDSRILTFGLFGDMALRLYWGDKPNFLLSVGGFHPKFTPPPLNLPELRRLTIVLANYDNLKIAVETYFAITSNSVQFGAKVAAMARAWKIEAVGALWFDILFQFRPFYFIADMGVMFAVNMGGKTILSLFLNLTLEGPNPWRARGKGSFKILFVNVTVSFDKVFGEARVEAIEAVDIDEKLKEALTQRDNWEAILPERNSQQVGFRELPSNTQIFVDPAGALKISQRLLPLGADLQKYGAAAIKDNIRYDINSVTVNNSVLPLQRVRDNFARNEFFNMTDDEKLSRESYELFDSGVLAGGSDSATSQYAVHKRCDYEQVTIDSGYLKVEEKETLTTGLMAVHNLGNYVSHSVLAAYNSIPTSNGPDRVRVSTEEELFIIANRNDLDQIGTLTFSSSVEAERYLSEQQAVAPANTADWIVANIYELAYA